MKDNQIVRAYSIKEVSRKINVPAGTIRQWEKDLNGLLNIPRTKQGSRYYTESEIALLVKIKEMRDKNLSKEIIRDMLQKHLHSPFSQDEAYETNNSLAVVEKSSEPKMEEFLMAMETYKDQFIREMSNEIRSSKQQVIEDVRKEIAQGSIETIKSLSKSIQRANIKTGKDIQRLSSNVSKASERTSETVEALTRNIAKSSEGAFESFSKRISEAAAEGYRDLLFDLSSSVSEAQQEIKSVTEAIYSDREHYFETMSKELQQYRHDVKKREEAFLQLVASFRDAAPAKEKEKEKEPAQMVQLKQKKKEKEKALKEKKKKEKSKLFKKKEEPIAEKEVAVSVEKKWWSFKRKKKK